MSLIRMTDLDLKGKTVLIREDFNVPIKNGVIVSDMRIKAALFTLEEALSKGAKLILMAHLGRPQLGQPNEAFSLEPIAGALSKHLKTPVKFVENWIDGVNFEDANVILCENVRFLAGELENDKELAQKMAALADVFVMDAFGTAHRAQASTYGVAKYAKIACAGPLLTTELEALTQALENPNRPLMTIVGGSKVSTKLNVLEAVIELSDVLIVGGGIANTFLAAQGYAIGKSLCETNLIAKAKELLQLAQAKETDIPLPVDVVVANSLDETATAVTKAVDDIAADEMILDVGPKTCEIFANRIAKSNTIVWNGPVGVFEDKRFAAGTKALALNIAASDAFSIAGGGDTLAAVEKFGISDNISYISTGGGAFLEFLEGKKLPAVAILEQRALLEKHDGNHA
ncbi:MAG: phosphoglycerate kinase [Pseudomonadota bacterium]